MASDEKHRQYGLGPMGLAAIIAAFLVFGLAALWLRQNPPGRTDLETDRAKERLERLAKLRQDENRSLNEYGWIDRGKGVVGLPVERAIELALPELGAKPVRPGPLIPPPTSTNAPPATTNTPPAATNAPPAATNAPPAGGTNTPPPAPPKTSELHRKVLRLVAFRIAGPMVAHRHPGGWT